jgi:hypothetical protein
MQVIRVRQRTVEIEKKRSAVRHIALGIKLRPEF